MTEDTLENIGGGVIDLPASEVMQQSYLDYSMSVIADRALPDVRDGLKPVHRRILYAMNQLNITPNGPHKKSARVIGEVLGKYHPHGDSAAYEAAVLMAQSWSLLHPLIDGQGNFGSVDGDNAAAMRYTEMRLSKVGHSMFDEIGKDTVNFRDNYDGTEVEPEILPVSYPNLWVNGGEGIAVGMATRIPPHNLRETVDAFLVWLDHRDAQKARKKGEPQQTETTDQGSAAPANAHDDLDDLFGDGPSEPHGTGEDNSKAATGTNSEVDAEQEEKSPILKAIVEKMPGPDFPTGGIVHGLDGYYDALRTGSGKVYIRAKWHEEQPKGKKKKLLVIDEFPYKVNKAKVLERIAELVSNKELDGISDLRDESDKRETRVVIELKSDVEPDVMFIQLLGLKVGVEKSFNYNTTCLIGLKPRQMGIEEIFGHFHTHRIEVIRRRTQYELDKALKRLHLLEGFLKALNNIDAAIAEIKQSVNREDAKERLQKLLSVDDVQAEAILDMKLQKLAKMETQAIQNEHDQLVESVADYRGILASNERQERILRGELQEVADRFGKPRQTEVAHELSGVTQEDLIPQEDVMLLATRDGFLKRLPLNAISAQNRGTRGKSIMNVGDGDVVTAIHNANTHDYLIAMTDTGQVHATKVYDIPESKPAQKGRHYRNIFARLDGSVVAMLSTGELDTDDKYLLTVSKRGHVKRTPLRELRNAWRQVGVKAAKIKDDDQIVSARICTEEGSLMLISDGGQALRFDIELLRPKGRNAVGVRGMRLPEGVSIIGAAFIETGKEKELDLLCISRKGIGKRTPVSEFSLKGRDNQGMRCFVENKRSGPLTAALVMSNEDVIIFTESGGANRLRAEDVPHKGRGTTGVSLMKTQETIYEALAVPPAPEEEEEQGSDEDE